MHASFLVALFFIASAVSPAVSIPLDTRDSSCSVNGLPVGVGDDSDCYSLPSFQTDSDDGNNTECAFVGCK
ncbi:hypothetical protein V8E53_006667 [Lactarius tabidus]